MESDSACWQLDTGHEATRRNGKRFRRRAAKECGTGRETRQGAAEKTVYVLYVTRICLRKAHTPLLRASVCSRSAGYCNDATKSRDPFASAFRRGKISIQFRVSPSQTLKNRVAAGWESPCLPAENFRIFPLTGFSSIPQYVVRWHSSARPVVSVV